MADPISPEDLDEVRAHNPDYMNGDTIDKLVARVEELESERDSAREIADEAWQWVDDLCVAIGPDTTVFTFKDDLRKLRANQNVVDELSRYTGELWYGTPSLRGKTEEVVRHIRGLLGSIDRVLEGTE